MSEEGAADGAPRSPSQPGPPQPHPPKPHGFPRARRLRRHNDFLRIERSGVRVQGRLVALVAKPGRGRIGFTVSKKVSLHAHERNLVKRRLREIVRLDRGWWEKLDVVVIAKTEAVGQPLSALAADVGALAGQLAERLRERPRAEKRAQRGEEGSDGNQAKEPKR